MRKLIATMILIASLLFLGGSLSGQDEAKHGYVGVDNCGMCHKGEAKGKQLEIWKNSPQRVGRVVVVLVTTGTVAAATSPKFGRASLEIECVRKKEFCLSFYRP